MKEVREIQSYSRYSSEGLEGENCHIMEKATWTGMAGSLEEIHPSRQPETKQDLDPTTTTGRSLEEDPKLQIRSQPWPIPLFQLCEPLSSKRS